MGLSSKQVSSDQELIDWSQAGFLQSAGTLPLRPQNTTRRQQHAVQPDPLKCPRCDSTNTKFCYYNNYNKSQPRHFCRACKRHWTKGGTLRNVPVGGVRKNKRMKRSNSATKSPTTEVTTTANSAATTNDRTSNAQMGSAQNLPIWLDDQKNNMADFLCQSFYLQDDTVNSLQFSFSNYNSFGTSPFSVPTSFQSSMTNASTQLPWQVPNTTNLLLDMPNYWNDIDTVISADLNVPWDDAEAKP